VTATINVTFEPDQSANPAVAVGQGQPAAEQQLVSLRVLDEPQPQGLLEYILGGVARALGL
jgi:hypothetical protein